MVVDGKSYIPIPHTSELFYSNVIIAMILKRFCRFMFFSCLEGLAVDNGTEVASLSYKLKEKRIEVRIYFFILFSPSFVPFLSFIL